MLRGKKTFLLEYFMSKQWQSELLCTYIGIIAIYALCSNALLIVADHSKFFTTGCINDKCPLTNETQTETLQGDVTTVATINCNCAMKTVNSIEHVTQQCSLQWLRLDLSLNSIKDLKSNIFDQSNCVNIIELKISINQITGNIVSFAFNGLAKLNVLSLYHNRITGFDADSFSGLDSLAFLNLCTNHINKIRLADFKPLKNLVTLNLSNNRIISIQSGSFQWFKHSISSLNLSSNYLVQISTDVLTGLSELRELQLSHNKITCLFNYNFAAQYKLEILALENNMLTYLTHLSFAGLLNLRSLNLFGNHIQMIDANTFCHLANSLIILHLTFTQSNTESTKIIEHQLNESLLVLNLTTKVYKNGNLLKRELHMITKSCGDLQSFDSSLNLSNSDDRLINSNDNQYIKSSPLHCPIIGSKDIDNKHLYSMDFGDAMSRVYLLIVVALCVIFLMVACLAILTYRSWSKNKIFHGKNKGKLFCFFCRKSKEQIRIDAITNHQYNNTATNKCLMPRQEKVTLPDQFITNNICSNNIVNINCEKKVLTIPHCSNKNLLINKDNQGLLKHLADV